MRCTCFLNSEIFVCDLDNDDEDDEAEEDKDTDTVGGTDRLEDGVLKVTTVEDSDGTAEVHE
jgi:hypothetical protein